MSDEQDAVAATPANAVEAKTDKLQEILKAHDIKDPEDVEGLIRDLDKFKKGFGQSQNELGELRRQITQLQSQLETKRDDYSGEPVDLKKEIKSVLLDFKREQDSIALEAQQRYLSERSYVESRPNWANVQPFFDKALLPVVLTSDENRDAVNKATPSG